MATLRKDSFIDRLPKDQRGKSSFYGRHVHTGITMQPPELAPEIARALYDEFPYLPAIAPTQSESTSE